jgi:hypothetical protein
MILAMWLQPPQTVEKYHSGADPNYIPDGIGKQDILVFFVPNSEQQGKIRGKEK